MEISINEQLNQLIIERVQLVSNHHTRIAFVANHHDVCQVPASFPSCYFGLTIFYEASFLEV